MLGSSTGLLRTNTCAGNREGATTLTREDIAELGLGALPDAAISNPTSVPAPNPRLVPTNGVGSIVSRAVVNDSLSWFTQRAAVFLLPVGVVLVGCLLIITQIAKRTLTWGQHSLMVIIMS